MNERKISDRVFIRFTYRFMIQSLTILTSNGVELIHVSLYCAIAWIVAAVEGMGGGWKKLLMEPTGPPEIWWPWPWILVFFLDILRNHENLIIVLQGIFTQVATGIRTKQYLFSLVESHLVVCKMIHILSSTFKCYALLGWNSFVKLNVCKYEWAEDNTNTDLCFL